MNYDDYQLETITDSPISAVARARVSEGSEDEIKNSIQSQKDAIRELAKRLNVGTIHWFIELEAVSAFKLGGDTEIFKRARSFACSNSDVKYFLQWDQTRFCRDRHSSQIFKRTLLKSGVEVRFCHGDIADRTSGSSVILDAVQEALAEADGIEKGQHVLRGCLTNAKNRDETTGWCFKNGGSPPYGYMRQRVNYGTKKNGDPLLKTVWVQNNEVVTCLMNGKEVSKTIASWAQYILIELRLNKGWGFNRIRDFLNEIQLPAPRKRYWSDTTVCEMTKNTAYAGVSIYNKHNWSSYRRGMGLKIKDTKDYIIEDKSHPALISKIQYELLQSMTKPANKEVRTKRKHKCESPYLLTFNFVCKSCGGPVIGRNSRYVCGTYDRKGKKACGASIYSAKQSWLEMEVLKIIGLTQDSFLVKRIVAEIQKSYKPTNNRSDIDILRKKIAVDEKAKASLLDILQQVTHEAAATKAIIARIDELEKSITGCNNEIARIAKPIVVPSEDALKSKMKYIANLYEGSNYERRRGILQTFVKQLVLDPFNKSVKLEAYRDPLCVWAENSKSKEKASDLAEALKQRYVNETCGGWI